jgi:hypothetical protein
VNCLDLEVHTFGVRRSALGSGHVGTSFEFKVRVRVPSSARGDFPKGHLRKKLIFLKAKSDLPIRYLPIDTLFLSFSEIFGVFGSGFRKI